MAVIEHRDIDGVINAYENIGLTKWALYQGTTPIMVYDGDDPAESQSKLVECLEYIHNGGTTAIYTLKVYPENATNITNKSAFKCATRFQLNSAQGATYQQTPDGKGIMVIRDQNRTVGNTNNVQLDKVLEAQQRLIELIEKQNKQREDDKFDKVIGLLTKRMEQPAEDSTTDKLMKLGEMIVDKPEIIDRIGYIFRPSLYNREEIPAEPAINGTTQTEQPKEKNKVENEETVLTEEEAQKVAILDERTDAALDKFEEIVGLDKMVELLECLANQKPDKLQKLTPEGINKMFGFL